MKKAKEIKYLLEGIVFHLKGQTYYIPYLKREAILKQRHILDSSKEQQKTLQDRDGFQTFQLKLKIS